MSAWDDLQARAAAQTPASSGVALTFLFGSLAQLVLGRPSVSACDPVDKALGLPHVRPCRAGGSRADLLVNPATGGAVRVGYDLPARFEVPTLPRFSGSQATGG